MRCGVGEWAKYALHHCRVVTRVGLWRAWRQVLITTDSCHVHREVARTMPIMRRYSRAKLNPDQVQTLGKVLDTYTE